MDIVYTVRPDARLVQGPIIVIRVSLVTTGMVDIVTRVRPSVRHVQGSKDVIPAILATTCLMEIVISVRPAARRVQGPIVVIRASLATTGLAAHVDGVLNHCARTAHLDFGEINAIRRVLQGVKVCVT